MSINRLLFVFIGFIVFSCQLKTEKKGEKIVPVEVMKEIYSEIQTPFKYGVVFKHADTTKMIDSPTIFRENDVWYMTYIVFDGQGYIMNL